jgi:DNA-binding transcriptional ArsR family regulator
VEQTRRIHERQRLLKTEAGLRLREEAERITRRHWNAQRLLEALPVVIPYADRLSFPASWMRTRRDHARFLNLIEVSAFLHQHQRERKGPAIVATAADYAVAYALAGEVLRDTLSDLKRPLRDAYERLRGLTPEADGTLSRRQIRHELGEPDSTVRRWLADLVELEYLTVAEAGRAGQGKTTRYRLAEQPVAARRVEGLLAPEALAQVLAGKG